MPASRICLLCLPVLLLAAQQTALPQGTVPTFTHTDTRHTYTLVGGDPVQTGTTAIPTVLVPITLTFQTAKSGATPPVMDSAQDVAKILASPVFSNFPFGSAGTTQYADAMLRTTFPGNQHWHTLLSKTTISPVTISVPPGSGYLLTSKKDGGTLAVVDADFVQNQLFKLLPKQTGKLVIAVTHNTTFYADGDATICCTWGTHGVDQATGTSFVLSSFLQHAPAIVQDRDVQPLTQQLAEFFNDPRHDPQKYGYGVSAPGNTVTAWTRKASEGGCGGPSIGSSYFLLEPTDTNLKNNIPASPAFVTHAQTATYHVQNVALLPWYTGASAGTGQMFSFPDASTLRTPALPCLRHESKSAVPPQAVPHPERSNGHRLIGYWTGHGLSQQPLPLRDVSPQWDVIIVAFASPAKDSPEGTLHFDLPKGLSAMQVKADIHYLQSQGKKVMLSLGGGGAYFTLADPAHIDNFVSSVSRIVTDYGFNGVDIDFESPSLVIQPGDTDFRHPSTPSIVNLIAGLRQLHDHFGSGFMISLVPEGTQTPGGFATYGGQFGSYLPIAHALRGILSFVDTQDYNTPPLQGLDGEIYQSHTVDYHAAMTELLLHGFNVGGDPQHFFPPLAANQVAVGFLTDYTTPAIVSHAMSYIITGKAPVGTTYRLTQPAGYPGMIGAMFWTIDDDLRGGYNYSNLIGPQLHHYSPAK